ncbi:MAG: hypothetical protein GY847_09660 [Proteobacteria bacterium]|nr:hypothetical protein [Pseudomonadota bacterium]
MCMPSSYREEMIFASNDLHNQVQEQFAVVAEEVRMLAGRSTKAAKETAEFIEKSDETVHEGIDVSNKTAASRLRRKIKVIVSYR